MRDDLVIFKSIIYVLNNGELKNLILTEFHVRPYLCHQRCQKTLTTTKNFYYGLYLKKERVELIAR